VFYFKIDDMKDDSLIIDQNIGYNDDIYLHNSEYNQFCNLQDECGSYVQFCQSFYDRNRQNSHESFICNQSFQDNYDFQNAQYPQDLCNNEFPTTSSIKICENVSNIVMNLNKMANEEFQREESCDEIPYRNLQNSTQYTQDFCDNNVTNSSVSYNEFPNTLYSIKNCENVTNLNEMSNEEFQRDESHDEIPEKASPDANLCQIAKEPLLLTYQFYKTVPS
ncbi:10766_t:CDS:2, partial [Gigaspora rosea]